MCEVWVTHGASPQLTLEALGTHSEKKAQTFGFCVPVRIAPLFRTHDVSGATVVNDLRLYADLLADPRRGEEQATPEGE